MSDTRNCVRSFKSIALDLPARLSDEKEKNDNVLPYPAEFDVAFGETKKKSFLMAMDCGPGAMLAIAYLNDGTFITYHASMPYSYTSNDVDKKGLKHPYLIFCQEVKKRGEKVFLLQRKTPRHEHLVPTLADNLNKSINDRGIEKIDVFIAELTNYKMVICDAHSKTIWATMNLKINSVDQKEKMIVTSTPDEEMHVTLKLVKLPEVKHNSPAKPAEPLRSQSPAPQPRNAPKPPTRSSSHSKFSFHLSNLFTRNDKSQGGVESSPSRKKSAGGGGY